MQVKESHLQSKYSAVPDDGGEHRLVVTEHYAAVIDGVTSKTDSTYLYGDKKLPPGVMAANILASAITEMPADLAAMDVCKFLNGKILEAYATYSITTLALHDAVERFTASIALYSNAGRFVILAGESQALIGYDYHASVKKVDLLNAEVRSNEIKRLINEGLLTETALMAMDINQDPGRKLIMTPGSSFPGLKGQTRHQNDPHSPYGYFVIDGFADYDTPGLIIVDVPTDVTSVVLATDGYQKPINMDPADVFYCLSSVEKYLANILENDPCCYKIYKSTKGKGVYHSFDDRAYVRLEI